MFSVDKLNWCRGATVVLVVAAVPLAGCVSDDDDLNAAYQPYQLQERYPITVMKGPVTLQIATTHGRLQPTQINAVVGFARQSAAGALTQVTISRPRGGKASAMAREIASLVADHGVPEHMIRMTTYHGSASSPIRLSVVRTHAASKPCGNWSENLADTYANTHMPNHGCAVRANMAAMMAKPYDAIVPESMSENPSGNNAGAASKIGSTVSERRTSWWEFFF
jgi:pilus assembly protein CpaD